MNAEKYVFHGIPIVVEPDKNFKEIKLPFSLVEYIKDLIKINIKYMEERVSWITKEPHHSDI